VRILSINGFEKLDRVRELAQTLLSSAVAVDQSDFPMWLFEETRAVHARFDALIGSFAFGDLTVDAYSDLLVRTHRFEAPLEAALAYTPGLPAIYELRPRSGLLVHDLLSLGIRPQQLAQLPQWPIEPFANVGTALGWLYPYERSRLKHPLLCSRVRDHVAEATNAIDYLCRDEIDVSKHWSEFVTAMEHFARTPETQQQIRDGARDAFDVAIACFSDDAMRVAG
jgi:heme oxygenase